MSKVESDRPRHVALRLEAPAPLGRRQFQEALQARLTARGWKGGPVRLTRHAWPHAMVRVGHDDLAALRAVLAGSWGTLQVETLGVSGTIAALSQRLGILTSRDGEASRASAPAPSKSDGRRPPSRGR